MGIKISKQQFYIKIAGSTAHSHYCCIYVINTKPHRCNCIYES